MSASSRISSALPVTRAETGKPQAAPKHLRALYSNPSTTYQALRAEITRRHA